MKIRWEGDNGMRKNGHSSSSYHLNTSRAGVSVMSVSDYYMYKEAFVVGEWVLRELSEGVGRVEI